MNIVILAAGQGKRMKSDLPKVLHPIAGRPMLGHVLETVKTISEANKICIVVGHGAESVKTFLEQNYSDVTTALQSDQRGTGHAVLQSLPHLEINDITLVLYGDVPLIQAKTLQQLLALAQDGALAILTQIMVDPTGYGRIVRNQQSEIIAIIEEKDANLLTKSIKEINTGILACPTKELSNWLSRIGTNNAQSEYYLTDIVSLAADDGVPVRSTHPQYLWETIGVNTREQLSLLEREWQVTLAKRLMDDGVSIVDPSRIDIRGNLICETDVFIDIGCVFEGQVTLGKGVTIGPYCVLKNCEIKPNTQVKAFSNLEQSVVGENSVIGPYARLRPGTELMQDVHIGNFVEIKNSQIGKGSKVNHLSYVGDATVGKGVNIGAGTITCNYDGVNKHRTIIEDDVFIGSDTQLIAPVTVGQGATLGAGTTLTKDAPANMLTVSRAKQISVNWLRPQKNKSKG